MGYPRCFEVNRDVREERRDASGNFNGSYDNNYYYNNMIINFRRENAQNKPQVVRKKRPCYEIVFK